MLVVLLIHLIHIENNLQVQTNASSVVTFTLSAGHTWAAPSVARNLYNGGDYRRVASGSASVGDVVSITGTGVASRSNIDGY